MTGWKGHGHDSTDMDIWYAGTAVVIGGVQHVCVRGVAQWLAKKKNTLTAGAGSGFSANDTLFHNLEADTGLSLSMLLVLC